MIYSVWFLEGIISEAVGCALFLVFLFVSVINSDTVTCVTSKVFPSLSEVSPKLYHNFLTDVHNILYS